MKKRIITICLVAALLATCFAGTYAYLTDTKAVKNTFTVGTVYITLTETNAVEGKNSYHLIPGKSYTKDPTITLVDGSEDAWVAAKVTVSAQEVGEKDLLDLIGISGTNMINVNAVASGGLLAKTPAAKENWNGLALVHETDDCVIYQEAGTNTWTLYIFMKNVQKAKAKTVLFKTLTIPAAWDNAEMDVVDTLEINVQAYAVQAYGFDDCYDAMTTAFKDAFKFN